MTRSAVTPMLEYFDRYINLVKDVHLASALEESIKDLVNLDINALEKIGNQTYAAGKWTIKEIFQHLLDTERVFCFRALLVARDDRSVTPDFDVPFFAANARANRRHLPDIIEELIALRRSTSALFNSFDDEMLLRKGKNWKFEMSVLGFGFCIAGHQLWHLKVLQEKYLHHLNRSVVIV